nr:TlpA disulfide reductase family protein [Thioalkalivibrio sp. XN8]
MFLLPLALLAAAAQAEIEVGDMPPDLLGETPKGEVIRISEHRGKVMVVSFWASWCPRCHEQFPALDLLQQHVDPDRLRVVLVNFKEHPRVYRDIVRETRKSPVTWTHDRDGTVSEAYGVNSVPRTFLIDKSGRVAMVRYGYSESGIQKLFEAIDVVLAEPAVIPSFN